MLRLPGMRPITTPEVQEVLDQIAVAITAGDGDAVAALWETPGFIIGPTMDMVLADDAAIAKLFASGREQYAAMGVVDTRAEILDLEWIGPDRKLCVVKVVWPYLDASGREVGAERSDYTLRRDESGALKVREILMRGVDGKH